MEHAETGPTQSSPVTPGPEVSLRIVIVAHYYPPHVGGIERVAQSQAELLAAAGHRVTVVTTAPGRRASEEQVSDRLVVHRVPALNLIERFTRVPFPLVGVAAARTLRRVIREADVVHIHDLFYVTSWLAALSAVLGRRRLVLTQHVHLIEHPSALVMLAQRIVYAVTGRLLLPRAAAVSYLNDTVRSFLLARGARSDRLAFLPNLVDTTEFRPPADRTERDSIRVRLGLPTTEVLGLFVGRFVPKKGFQTVVGSAGRGYRLLLAGGPPEPDRAGVGPAGGVDWLGSLDRAQLAEVYRCSDFFVLPSISEGFPLTVGEAMSSGLPVITTDDPGYAIYQLDRSRVRLIEPDQDSVRTTIGEVAHDTELRRAMGAYSRDYAVAHFRADAHLAGLLALYRPAGDRVTDRAAVDAA